MKMIYFSGLRLSTTGPRLSPHSLLWAPCEPSQYGHCKNKTKWMQLGMVNRIARMETVWKHLRSSTSSIGRRLLFRQYLQYRRNQLPWLRSSAPSGWHDLVEFVVGHVDKRPNTICNRFQPRPLLVELELPNRALKQNRNWISPTTVFVATV